MINKLLGAFSKDIGIDLGTANTLVYVRGKGIVINEPSVVSLNNKTGQVIAVGHEAKRMLGKTPPHISAIRPLYEGVISDFEVTEQMLKFFIDKVHKETFTILPRPRVVIGIPSNITEVEKKAVEDAAKNAGAREVYLVEEPMAAAIGARMQIQEPHGSMIVDIGGGTTDVSIISLGGAVVSRNIRVAGDKLTNDIIHYAKEEYNLLLGEKMAEEIKVSIGSAHELSQPMEIIMRGRDLVSGLPKEVVVDDSEVRYAMEKSVKVIIDAVRSAIEEAPPELVADIMHNGIVLAGGGSLLKGLAKKIEEETLMPVHICEDPLTAVVRGTGIILEDLDNLRGVLADNNYYGDK